MDLLLVSKQHGVLGRQPIEAQSVGTAVLAVNGHSKKSTILINEVGGYLVDSVEELKQKLLVLISNPAHLKNLGANHIGRKIKGKFVNVWSIKNFQIQTEEFKQPNIEKEAYE
jgi:glycosyltransferase involved in cell wall biosynthesis